MRNPLNTIQMAASYLAALNAGSEISKAASSLIDLAAVFADALKLGGKQARRV
jgi:hypothetical protein